MRHKIVILAAAALVAAAALPAAAADCVQPGPAPVLPDGTVATQAQMATAHTQVQGYVNVLQTFQDCEEAHIKDAPKDMKPEDKQKMRDAGNAAIDQAQALSANYSAQLKAFKARSAQ